MSIMLNLLGIALRRSTDLCGGNPQSLGLPPNVFERYIAHHADPIEQLGEAIQVGHSHSPSGGAIGQFYANLVRHLFFLRW
jgi:hypothetical protein